jgi:4-amino-4-deoxy-L-arabinose transferase-like glycosyltransferase
MFIHQAILWYGSSVTLGIYLFFLLRFGGRGWRSIPSDIPPRERGINMWLVTSAWTIFMGNLFVYHPDRFPLLGAQILAVVAVTGSAILFYLTKAGVWRYTYAAGSVAVATLGYIHLFRS